MKWLSIVWFVETENAKVQHANYGLKGERTVCGLYLSYMLDDNDKIPARLRNKNRLNNRPRCKRCEKALMKRHGTLTGRVKVDA